jgi:hypothetical protein
LSESENSIEICSKRNKIVSLRQTRQYTFLLLNMKSLVCYTFNFDFKGHSVSTGTDYL